MAAAKARKAGRKACLGKLCGQMMECEGGCFGCTLPSGHVVRRPPRRTTRAARRTARAAPSPSPRLALALTPIPLMPLSTGPAPRREIIRWRRAWATLTAATGLG